LEKLLYRLFPKKQEQPIDIEKTIKNKDYFEAYFCFTIDNRIYNKDLEIFLENIKTKEQLIEEVNYDLAYKNGQNIGKLLEQILLHPKTALIDEKKLLIVNAFMHIGDYILNYFNLKNYGIDVSKNLYILIKTFLNDLFSELNILRQTNSERQFLTMKLHVILFSDFEYWPLPKPLNQFL
jgi:hypothetical protein